MDLEKVFHRFKKGLLRIVTLDKWYFLFLILLTVSVYAFCWKNNFISDDIAGIVDNPSIGNALLYLKAKSITQVIHALIYNIFGLNVLPFHIVSTLFHVLNVLLVYSLAYLLAKRKPVARITSVIFAVHPLLTEPVVWISALSYLIYTSMLLLSFILYILQDRKKIPRAFLLLSAFLYFIALFTNANAISFPLIVLMYAALYSKLNKKLLISLVPFFIVGLLYGIHMIPNVSTRVNEIFVNLGQTAPIMNPLKYVPISILNYVQLLFAPVNLRFYHEPLIVSLVLYFFAVFLTIAVTVGPFLIYKYSKSASLGLFIFAVSFMATWYPIQVAWIVAERYAYFGAFGFILFIASLLDLYINKKLKKPEYLVYLLTIVVLIFSGLSIRRVSQWKSEDTMWPVTVKSSPYSAFAHNNIGDYYVRHKDYPNAIKSFETARKLRKNYAEATNNLANVYATIGEATQSAKFYEEALYYNPNLYHPHMGLGQILLTFGYLQEAEKHFLQAIKLNPIAFREYIFLIKIAAANKDKEKALQYLTIMKQKSRNLPDRIQLINQLQNEIEKL